MPRAKLVYIVDDEISAHKELTRLLSTSGYEVQAFATADAFLSCANLDRPCCLLLDEHMPDQSGFAVQECLLRGDVGVPIIFMTGHGDIARVVRAMKAGAVDFLAKPVSSGELLPAIELALAQSIDWHGAQSKRLQVRKLFARLTCREREVLAFVLAGRRNKQIANALGSQEATVKVHRSRLMRKLETRTLAELLRFGQHIEKELRVPADRRDLRRGDVPARVMQAPIGGMTRFTAGGVPPAGGRSDGSASLHNANPGSGRGLPASRRGGNGRLAPVTG